MAEQEQATRPNARRGRWKSFIDSVTYINQLSKRADVKVRESDRITSLSVLVAAAATTLCLVLHKLTGVSLYLTLLCDFFLGISIVLYVSNRIGILTTLTPRQAWFVWQLMQAFSFVGVFITINIAVFLSIFISDSLLHAYPPY